MRRVFAVAAFAFSAFVITAFSSMAVSAAPTVDKSNLAKGIVGVTYDGDMKENQPVVIIQHPASGTTYQYFLKTATEQFALQSGDGEYKVVLGTLTPDNRVKALVNEPLTVKIDEKFANDRWLIQTINNTLWNKDMASIVAFAKLIADAKPADAKAKLTAAYAEMTKNYVYNDQLAADIKAGKVKTYYPVIDDVYKAKKGICYDYASLFASALRSQGIPTRVVFGFSPDVDKGTQLHAWNEVLLDGKWVTMDTTVDAAYVQKSKEIKAEKDGTKYKITKLY